MATAAGALVPEVRPSAGPREGTYVATELERRQLPTEIVVKSDRGYSHWVRVQQASVRLRGDGHFVASVRYYHEYLAAGSRPRNTPVSSESWRGTYTVDGTKITFRSNPSKKGAAKPVSGLLSGDRIALTYRVRELDQWRTMTALLTFDPSYW